MSTREFDRLDDGRQVLLVELGTAPGPVLRLLTLGATVHELEVCDADGQRIQVALGHPTSADYLASQNYLGGTIGRYANRIRDGNLPLPSGEFRLGTNDRGHHLHGGPDGFDRRLWTLLEEDERTARFGLVSPDGDQGHPGTLTVEVTYVVTDTEVLIDFAATTDRTTVVNLTQHTYFNLEGRGAGTVDEHLIEVPASRYTPVDSTGIPHGTHSPVDGTPFDLRSTTRVGSAARCRHPQVLEARGIDHNLVVDSVEGDDGLRRMCTLAAPRSGIRLEVRSDQPGLQVYTGNFLDGTGAASGGGLHRQGDGIALEPQLYPDTPHHVANSSLGPAGADTNDWPSALLRPGELYRARHAWLFSAVREK